MVVFLLKDFGMKIKKLSVLKLMLQLFLECWKVKKIFGNLLKEEMLVLLEC